MCIALWYLKDGKFVLLFNREEFSQRRTKKLGIIKNSIACGLDLVGGGTWLAVNVSNGNIAFVTNRNSLNSKEFKQKLKMLTLMLRNQFPRVFRQFFPPFQSRGELVIELVDGQNYQNECKIEDESIQANISIQNNDEESKVKAQKAAINSYKYRPFNLFVGSIPNMDFSILSSITGKIQKVQTHGSAFSFSNIGEQQLFKESIGLQKLIEIVEKGQNLEERLFQLAQEQFNSSEIFFKCCKEESSFFIPEYKTIDGRMRGTRTTTLVIYENNQLKMLERTYI